MTPSRTTPRPPAELDVSGRAVRLRDVDLDAFFHPRTVAVIGASATGRKPNTAMWKKISAWGRRAGAEVIPVHPAYDEIDGVRCYDTIADVPGDVDLAVILVGDAVGMFEQVLEKQPRFAVIFSAGFAETGAEGRALQQRLEDLIRSGDTHLLGPNTNLNAFEDFREDLPAPKIALITQSGHQGRPVFQAQDFGVAMSHWAPTGNEADLEFADFARYFADQPEVGAIACYIEGFRDGRTLILAADHAARAGVPIVCVKVGKTDEGASMARSHTGHLSGSDRITDAVFRQYGITRVDGLDELTDTAAMFTRTRRPGGDGVCIYAISGGTGAHMADLCADAGLRIPPLTRKTQKILHDGLIPPYLRVSNPVDNGGPPSTDERGRKIIDAILADRNVDIVICPITGALETISRPLATDLVAAAATTDKPIFVVWGSPDLSDPVYREILLPSGLPVFRTFHNCVQAARAYVDYWAFRDRYRSPFDDVPVRRSSAARRVAPLLNAARGHALSEHGSKEILRAYKIPTTEDELCTSASQAVAAAKRIGFPVVLKVSSPDLLHKSDLGLVKVGLDSPKAVRAAYDALMAAAGKASRKAAGAKRIVRIEGVLVSEMVSGGVETVLGVSHDELFGPTVMFGLGGVFVEVFEDVAFRVPPFDRDEALRMVQEIKGYPLLTGARGARPVDLKALLDAIMKVQRLAMEQADVVTELDINPLVALPRGVRALDALVVTGA